MAKPIDNMDGFGKDGIDTFQTDQDFEELADEYEGIDERQDGLLDFGRIVQEFDDITKPTPFDKPGGTAPPGTPPDDIIKNKVAKFNDNVEKVIGKAKRLDYKHFRVEHGVLYYSKDGKSVKLTSDIHPDIPFSLRVIIARAEKVGLDGAGFIRDILGFTDYGARPTEPDNKA